MASTRSIGNLPHTAPGALTGADGEPAADSGFDALSWERTLGQPLGGARWVGWRLRLLVAAALLGCLGLFIFIRALAAEPTLGLQGRAGANGGFEIALATQDSLRVHEGRTLVAIAPRGGSATSVDALALQRSPRWLVSDAARERHSAMHAGIAQALRAPEVQLSFADGSVVRAAVRPYGVFGLGSMFWLLCSLALVLYLVGMVVLLARPSMRNLLYATMCLCQAGNQLFIAVEALPGPGLPGGFQHWSLVLRSGFDLATAAAIVHATGMHPCALPKRQWIAAASWVLVALLLVLLAAHLLPGAWWWIQGLMATLGLVAIAQLTWSYHLERNPFAVVLRRFGIVTLGTLTLLTVAVAAAERLPTTPHHVSAVGSVVFYVFLGSLLVLMPFLSRSQQLMREFSMLAGISTVATSLDLLFVAVFSLGQFASLTLSLFLSLGVYAGVRQWILNQLIGSNMLTTERMFEQLYRIAREVEAQPEKVAERMQALLRELYEPIESMTVERATSRARVVGDGSTLLVPVPQLADDKELPPASIVLRFARRGTRMFTQEDARLTDRVVEQLKRAVAFDKAVEQGRTEERVRIAQDLHDDIGARLLTLMYKAQTPEMEDYVRHTLKDLKTLTRGLAASNHRLSHAMAEWKADITQRLNAANCELAWSFTTDRDMLLSVVQWSALTRVLRELVSNTIAHALASHVDIEGNFEDGRLTLTVTDDGIGRNPQAWSHGLGLGGVRKRVKQLGGDVQWREVSPQGISCRVRIDSLAQRR